MLSDGAWPEFHVLLIHIHLSTKELELSIAPSRKSEEPASSPKATLLCFVFAVNCTSVVLGHLGIRVILSCRLGIEVFTT